MSDMVTAIRSVLAESRDQARVMERALTQDAIPAGSGTGTVTSVALTVPSIFSVSGSPITVAGTLAVTLANQSANKVLAGPTGGGAAAPTFRALVAADIPALSYGTGTVTSVALSLPGIFSVSGSPVTGSGTLTGALANQTANYIWAGPVSGGAAAPTFRAMVADDVPNALITYAKIQNMTTARLLGRTTAGAGVVEEISVGAGLTLSAGVLDTVGGAAITGTGTDTYLTRWTGASTIGDSTLYLSSGKIISATSNSGLKVQRTGANAASDNVADASFGFFATMSNLAVDRDGGGIIVHTAGFSSDSSTEETRVYGHLIWHTDATYDIGASGANRARDAHLSRSLYAASIKLRGSGSGTATITPPAAAGTPTLTLPTTTGTLALTSDINTAVSGTSGKLAKFTGANTVGNSIITESGATISVPGTVTIVGQSNTNQLVVEGHTTQTASQIVIQTSAAAELARIYVSATNSLAIGYQAGAALTTASGAVAIGYQALNAMAGNHGAIGIGLQAGKLATSSGTIAIGYTAAAAVTSNNLIAIGYQAGNAATGDANILVGYQAGWKVVAGASNVAMGHFALNANVNGTDNFALGYQALFASTSSYNVAIGSSALRNTTAGNQSVAIGQAAGYTNISGNDNVFIGFNCGFFTTSSNNVGIGSSAMKNTAGGSGNIAIGQAALYTATAASNCTAIGFQALFYNTSDNNSAIGYQALFNATGGSNTGIGVQALKTLTSGTNNVAIGFQAGYSMAANGAGVFIGYQAGYSETGANRLYISNTNTTTPLVYGLFSGTGAGLRVTSQATDGTPLVVRGKASQTSTLQEWQDSTNSVVASVNKAGMISGSMDTMTYAATISLDVTLPNLHKTTTVHATGNATINASGVGTAGQHMWILIVNDATSGKVITFGTNFKSTGALTGTTSKQATIHFISDGVSWSEVARTLNL